MFRKSPTRSVAMGKDWLLIGIYDRATPTELLPPSSQSPCNHQHLSNTSTHNHNINPDPTPKKKVEIEERENNSSREVDNSLLITVVPKTMAIPFYSSSWLMAATIREVTDGGLM